MSQTQDNPNASVVGEHEFALGDELRGERATLGKTLLDVQRDLRIKAAFVDAIENGDLAAFPIAGAVPGYIRSYARYLSLDPDVVYRRFCAEHGFSVGGTRMTPASAARGATVVAPPVNGFRPDFRQAAKAPRGLPAIPVQAIGSLLVLSVLVAGLGYGGWTVLQNIQRVQFAPVDELPVAVAEVDELAQPGAADAAEPVLTELARPVAATDLADLYRHQELEVPILVPRDGPIAGLNPDKIGLLAGRGDRVARDARDDAASPSPDLEAQTVAAMVAASVGPGGAEASDPQVIAASASAPAPLTVVAERAAWIRVYLDNGTIIFERILEKGETYSPPEGVGAPLIWAGNAGSVYVKVGDTLHGPLGRGTRAAKDVVLEPQSIAAHFPAVEQVPEVVSQTLNADAPQPEPAVAIQ